MSRKLVLALLSTALLVAVAAGLARRSAASATSPWLAVGRPDIRAADALAFAPDDILLIGDSQQGSLHAVQIRDDARADRSAELRVEKIDRKLAGMLGTTPDSVVVRDMAVHPVSGSTYLSVAGAATGKALLVKVTREGRMSSVPLDRVPFATLRLRDAPAAGARTPWGAPARELTITKLGFVDGQVLVAGLSSEAFASRLRRVPFPFQKRIAATGVEIFHTSHGRYETHAPIESFVPIRLKGAPHLLAGYGCAPLATFSMDKLTSQGRVRGTTVAELGGGNRPLDMIELMVNGKPHVFIANSHRTLMRMAVDDIERARPMTAAVPEAYASAGAPYLSIAMVGVLQLAKVDEGHFAVLARDTADGSMTLASFKATVF
jgi:hypothetical protein